jgi:hypothetical protein
VVGSKNYKLSTIIDHERSNMHVRAVGITKSKEQALTQTTTAHKTVIALKEHTRKDLEYKFRNIHALIKKNRPISDVKWLSIVREKNFILDKISFSFSFSVVDINSMKRVAAVVLSYVVL